MLHIVVMTFAALAIFFATVVNMALKKENQKLSIIIVIVAAVIGAFFYSYGYGVKIENDFIVLARTVLSVSGMFIGRWDFTNVDDTELFTNPVIYLVFLIVHFLALYSLANVVMMKLGSSLLRRLRILLLHGNDLTIIFGLSEESIFFANRLRESWKNGEEPASILFVPDETDNALLANLERDGWPYRTDSTARYPRTRFLRSLGIWEGDDNRKITLYALSREENLNRQYTAKLLESLQKSEIPAENLSLTIYTTNVADISKMQALKNRYGYTDVNPFDSHSLTARLLTLEYPVYNTIRFNDKGLAEQNLDVVIAGFGSTGQAVLRALVRNGQFEGSEFHAAVFAPEIYSIAGHFFTVYEELCSNYSIDFNEYDARSMEASEYVRAHATTLKYVVACTGDSERDWEIIRAYEKILGKHCEQVLLLICGKGTVTRVGSGSNLDIVTDIWRNETLNASIADRAAKAVNASYYSAEDGTPEELWRSCTPFSRESCRAAADFTRAYCRIAGISEKDAAQGAWDLDDELLENLSKTEHLRWNAFHRSMGWSLMPDEEFAQRAEIYRFERMKYGKPMIRIAKNETDRHHACLVTWEDLQALSDKENAITGKQVDYQQFDRDNVMAVPALLRAFGY